MANWITHAALADLLMARGLPVDRTYFSIGSIAPDCNQENADWTSYTPPREQTHFMLGKNKSTVDAEGFFEKHIRGREGLSIQRRSFLMGWLCHLVADRTWQRWQRDENRVAACFERIRQVPSMAERLTGHPDTYDTLKAVFGRDMMQRDVWKMEQDYVLQNPSTCFETVIRKTTAFPDIPGFPPDAVNRKIPILAQPIPKEPIRATQLFFTPSEYENLLNTAVSVFEKIIGTAG